MCAYYKPTINNLKNSIKSFFLNYTYVVIVSTLECLHGVTNQWNCMSTKLYKFINYIKVEECLTEPI